MTATGGISADAESAAVRQCRVLFSIGTMGAGGAERQILEYLKRLDRSRFKLFLSLDHAAGELLSYVPADIEISSFWEPSRRSRILRPLMSLHLTHVASILYRVWLYRRVRPDVIYDRTFMATLSTAVPAWLCGVPRVSCAVVDPAPELPVWFPRSTWFGFRWAKWAYRTARYVICNSECLREQMIAYFNLNPARVVTRLNLLDLQRLLPFDAAISDHDTSAVAAHRLVIVGRLHPQKGHRILLEAMSQLVHCHGRNLTLAIVGQGHLLEELQRLTRDLNLSDRVIFYGFQPEPLRFVAEADLFILPSFYEGSPNALIEAVALGLPVIACDCPTGPREILENGRWGRLVEVGNVSQLAVAIDETLQQLDAARATAQLAAKVIRDRHDPERGTRELESLLLSAATFPT